MKKWAPLFILFFACSSPSSNNLKIACASNLEAGMDSIVSAFESIQNAECELIAESTGMLASQIEAGAPYHIFIAADENHAIRLDDQGLSSQPIFFRSEEMVLVNLSTLQSDSIHTLLNSKEVTKIGIADPNIAPYGAAAKQFLLQESLWSDVEYKIVYAESVGRLNSWIQAKTIDVAFTTKAFVVQSSKQYHYLNLTNGPKVNHFISIIHQDDQVHPMQREFIDFLLSDSSSKILEYFGY